MSDESKTATELLFSYGALMKESTQLAAFGRALEGDDDELEGYSLTMLQIVDPAVTAMTGETEHPIIAPTGQPEDRVSGKALRVTESELLRADEYEVTDYRREMVKLVSGRMAWAFVDARLAAFDPDDTPD